MTKADEIQKTEKVIERVSKGNGILAGGTLVVGLYCAQALWTLDQHIEDIVDDRLEAVNIDEKFATQEKLFAARIEVLQANLRAEIREEVQKAVRDSGGAGD